MISASAGTSRSLVSHLTSLTGLPASMPVSSGSGIGDGAQAAIAASGDRPIAVAKGQVSPRGR